MVRTWAPDDFWEAAQPLIPIPAARPQGGGKRRADDRAVLAAIVYLVRVTPRRDHRPSLGNQATDPAHRGDQLGHCVLGGDRVVKDRRVQRPPRLA
jgi:hypothetical protein